MVDVDVYDMENFFGPRAKFGDGGGIFLYVFFLRYFVLDYFTIEKLLFCNLRLANWHLIKLCCRPKEFFPQFMFS